MKISYMMIAIMILAMMVRAVQAQEASQKMNQNEIRIGYGVLTGPEIANSLFSLWPAIGIDISKDTIKDYNSTFHGLSTLEYQRFAAGWISLGGSLSINPVGTVITTNHGLNLTWNYYILNLMPKVSLYYLNRETVALYSGVEAGGALVFWRDRQGSSVKTDVAFMPAFHINALGVRIGKQIGGFMEWGFGYRGIVNFGVSARF